MSSRDSLRLAREVAQLRRDLDAMMRGTQLSHSSIEAGALRVYDEDGDLRVQVGRQADGSYGVSVPEDDTGWIPLPGINGWVWYGGSWETPAYRKLNGIVYLRGLLTGGAAGTAFCVLPPGYRASGNRHFPVAAGGTIGLVNVMADGTIKHNSGPTVWVSLDGITYPADG